MRRLLPVLALVAALLSACGGVAHQRPMRDATLVLDFTPNAAHVGIYTALARGYDKAEGVRLHVRVPGSSTDAVKLLLAGRIDAAVMDIHDLALARARGRDLVGVMAIVQRPLAAVLTTKDVRSPRQLQGRKVGVTGLPSDTAVLRSIVAGAGGDPDRVQQVTIGFNAVPAVLGGKVAGATAFWNVEGVALREQRPRDHVFRVDDYGAPRYPELVLVTTRAKLDQDPSKARAVVRALVHGYSAAVRDPSAGISDLQTSVPGLDKQTLRTQLSVLLPALNPAGSHIGALNTATLEAWATWETRFGIVPKRPNVATTFDTSLLPG